MVQYKDETRQKQWARKQQDRAAAAAAEQAERASSGQASCTATKREPAWERKLPSAKRRQLEAKQDEEDFAVEYRMLRKLKRGKLNEVGASSASRHSLWLFFSSHSPLPVASRFDSRCCLIMSMLKRPLSVCLAPYVLLGWVAGGF